MSPIGQMDEDEVRTGRDPGRAAGPAVSGRDVHDPGAVRTAAPAVRDRRVVAQPLVRPRVPQRPVDFCPIVDGAVAVRVRGRPRRLIPLVPE